jgi:hypothetical protein
MTYRKRTARNTTPRVESLEGRVVLSTVAAPHPGGGITGASLVRGASYLFINGTAHGTAHATPGMPDTGAVVALHGTGMLTPLGNVRVSGNLVGTGFIQQGNATGSIVLTNARGSVTLHLDGPSQPGFTPPGSGTYQFSIQRGTGAYAHTIGTGTVDLTLSATSFTMTFHGAPNRF